MEKDSKTFEQVDKISLASKEKTEELAQEFKEEIEEKKQKTTKTGRKSKEAKDAENIEVIAGILEPMLIGIESAISSKIPEFKHEEEELKTMATLGAPVIDKRFDLDALKYQEEARLISYIVMCEMPRAKAYLQRLKEEARQRQEDQKKEAKNKADLEDEKDKENIKKGVFNAGQ